MRRHRGLCAFRARSSGVAAQTKPLCSSRSCSPPLAAGPRPPPLRWQKPSASAGHKVSPSPLPHGGRGRLSDSPGWGGLVGRAVGRSRQLLPAPGPFALHSSGSPARRTRRGNSATC